MVKCITSCLKFFKIFKKPANDGSDSKVIQQSIQNNPEALNITSLQDKEVALEYNDQMKNSNSSPSRHLRNSSPSKLLNPYQLSPEKPSLIVSECCLSPISKRSHSEDLSPVKIPSPKYTPRFIPNIFSIENICAKPKIYAATPRNKIPRSLRRIMNPIEV